MKNVHKEPVTADAYRTAITRMIRNIADTKVLRMIYKYVLRSYTKET